MLHLCYHYHRDSDSDLSAGLAGANSGTTHLTDMGQQKSLINLYKTPLHQLSVELLDIEISSAIHNDDD